MRVLHLPPRHLLRVTLLAAAAALAVTLLLLTPAGSLAPDADFRATEPQSQPVSASPWPADPFAIPTVELPPPSR